MIYGYELTFPNIIPNKEVNVMLVLEMRGIVKRFGPSVVANDHIELTLEKSEILALLGENGAGKTTLMNILAGLYQADSGEIWINGNQVMINQPSDAIKNGIGMVHQNFMLVPTLTVTENIALGTGKGKIVFDSHQIETKIQALSEQYGLEVNPKNYIWQLSVGEQQRVEILKTLYRQAQILILDEPTSVLAPQEIEELGKVLLRMVESGKSVILITHKLDEVIAFSDRVTILRAGKNVATLRTSETTREELTQLMVGEEVVRATCNGEVTGPVTLKVNSLSVLNDKGLPAVTNVSFNVQGGEIVGIAGIAGNGQTELVEALTGSRRAVSGAIKINGADVNNQPPITFINLGVGYVPEDRRTTGTVAGMTLAENVALKGVGKQPLSWGLILNMGAIKSLAQRLIASFRIEAPGPETIVSHLSGGNLQRVILARETSQRHTLLIVVHPTRGLDVRATEMARQILLRQRLGGTAILWISEDLEELLQVCDRILVMRSGQIVGCLGRETANKQTIGALMVGGVETKGGSQ